MNKVFICFIVMLLYSCEQKQNKPEQATANAAQSAPEVDAAEIDGTYQGIVPCADCEGIRMQLTLEHNKATGKRTYTLRETYLGKTGGKGSAMSSGTWSVQRGTPQRSEAIIYQLTPDNSEEKRSFLKVNDNEIKLLDGEQQEVQSELNYSLKRQML